VTPEQLISDPDLRRIFGNVSAMTIWRWREAGILPQPIKIRKRNYTPAHVVAEAQERLLNRESEVA
jgi:hypothetical protein